MLRKALNEKSPLFREPAASEFLKFRAPAGSGDDELSLRRRLSRGTWLHEKDILTIERLSLRVSRALVHFDPYWFIYELISERSHVFKIDSDNDFRALLLDRDKVTAIFSSLLSWRTMSNANLYVRTIKPPYAVAASRFKEREARLGREEIEGRRFCAREIYSLTASGETIYKNIYEAWRTAFGRRMMRGGSVPKTGEPN